MDGQTLGYVWAERVGSGLVVPDATHRSHDSLLANHPCCGTGKDWADIRKPSHRTKHLTHLG